MKMKTIYNTFLILFSCMAIFSSCSEDRLDVEPFGKYAQDPDPNRPLDLNMIDGEARGLYSQVSWCYNTQWGYSTYVTFNSASDDAVSGGAAAGDRPEYEAAEKFTLDPNNLGVINLWKRFYSGIGSCNKLLDNYPDKDIDTLKRAKAEAKFLRAYYYFNLVNIFGPVPMPLKSTDLAEMPNTPIAEIYAQIEKDLNDAIASNGLPKSKKQLSSVDLAITRATEYTVRAFLGKVYVYHSTMLNENKWQDAKAQLEAVKNSGEYSLVTNFRSLWSSKNEMKDGNPESIFEASYTDIYGENWGGVATGNLDMQLMGIRDLQGYPGLDGGWGFCKPTQKLVDAFIAESDSIRLDATVVAASWPASIAQWEADKKLLPSLNSKGAKYSEPYDPTGYWNGKYRQDEHPLNADMYAQNELIYRFSDVLLLLAETEYHLGNEAAALGYVNQIRDRVHLAPKSSTGMQLLNDIRKERQLELAMETQRYWDLIRWGLAAQEIPNFKTSTKGLWPIPQEQLNVDPLLKQNEGY